MIAPRLFLGLIASLATSSCNSGAAADEQAGAIARGEWEVTTTLVGLSLPALEEAEVQEMRDAFAEPRSQRQCLTGTRPKVGDGMLSGRCTYTKVDDTPGRVDRVATCSAAQGGPVKTIETSGTASSDRYDYLVVTRQGGNEWVEVREQGRRIGPCRS